MTCEGLPYEVSASSEVVLGERNVEGLEDVFVGSLGVLVVCLLVGGGRGAHGLGVSGGVEVYGVE